jgi:hypothetical protein
MPSRYLNKTIIKTTNLGTQQLLRSRDLRNIDIVETIYFKPLSDELRKSVDVRTVIWQTRTRMFKLAHEFYGDSRLWWIIGWFNQRPTDAHYAPGDLVYIPIPPEEIIRRIE